MTLNLSSILWPVIALVARICIVWGRLYFERFAHLNAHPPSEDDFKDGFSAMRYFAPVQSPANNLGNLTEMPVLFFALVPLLLLTGADSMIQTGLAWAYLLFRILHSYHQIITKTVIWRFRVYLMSCVVLLAMWVGFVVDLIR